VQPFVWTLALLAFDEHVIPANTAIALLLAAPPLYPSKLTTLLGTPIRPDELRARGAPGEDPTEAPYRMSRASCRA